MKKKALLALLAGALVAVLVSCGGSGSKSKTFTLMNNTGVDLVEMSISHVDAEDWSDQNFLEGKTLADGKSIEISKDIFEKEGTYDVSFTDANDEFYFVWDFNPATDTKLTVKADDKG
jgi:hypothetical protein